MGVDRTDKGKGEGAIYLLNFDGSPTALLSLVRPLTWRLGAEHTDRRVGQCEVF